MAFRDLILATRGFRRERVYAAAVIGTFALALGSATAVFSIVDGVLLRPLPYQSPERLVSIREVVPKWAHQYPTLPANARHFDHWRNQSTSYEALAALDWRTTSLSGAGEPFQATILRSSATLFEVLALTVARGRALTRDDESAASPRVTVISDELWRTRLGTDLSAIGRSIRLGGIDHTIVGILPPRTELPAFDTTAGSATLRSRFSAIVPFRWDITTMPWMGSFNHPVVGRLRAGISLDQSAAELSVLQQSVARLAAGTTNDVEELRAQVVPLAEAIVGSARPGLLLLLGAVAAVVLIACANLANLSLTRSMAQTRDRAVRTALGASRASLVRTIVVEQLVLAVAGGVLGVVFAYQAVRLFALSAPIDIPRIQHVAIDARVLTFAVALTIASGLIVALLPAWRIVTARLQPLLRSGGHGSTDAAGIRVRTLLLTTQVALSVALLIVTGLFVTSFARLTRVDPGFDPEGVVTMEIAPVSARYPDVAERASLYDRITEKMREAPGLVAVSWTSSLPLTGETWVDPIGRVENPVPEDQRPQANYRFVGPAYFQALAMPVLKGRPFDDRDRSRSVTPAVISAHAARVLWPREDPLGKLFSRGDPSSRFEVVGVVVDGRATALETESPLMVYVPYWYNNEGKSLLIVRATADDAAALRAMRGAVRAVDPEIAIGDAGPLRAVVDKVLDPRRYQMSLFVAFGSVALLIATIGVYAATTYTVSRRRREMNIRVALGAPIASVFALILRQSGAPVAGGVAAGCAVALALGTTLRRMLFEVQPNDPIIIAGAAVFMCAAGVAAAAIAARQGLRINPVEALRED
jgi:putative ABC transport system permease protein